MLDTIFEKHIGIKTKKYNLNNYSTNPSQFISYLENLEKVKNSLGFDTKIIDKNEIGTLSLLERGVYAKSDIKKNTKLNKKNIYFAFPKKKNQISTNDFSLKSKSYLTIKNIKKDQGRLTRKWLLR